MTKKELEKVIEDQFEEAAYQYKRGNLKAGKKAEKNARELKKFLKYYD